MLESWGRLSRATSLGESADGSKSFGTWFSRHGGVGLTVGLDDLRGLFQP